MSEVILALSFLAWMIGACLLAITLGTRIGVYLAVKKVEKVGIELGTGSSFDKYVRILEIVEEFE